MSDSINMLMVPKSARAHSIKSRVVPRAWCQKAPLPVKGLTQSSLTVQILAIVTEGTLTLAPIFDFESFNT